MKGKRVKGEKLNFKNTVNLKYTLLVKNRQNYDSEVSISYSIQAEKKTLMKTPLT